MSKYYKDKDVIKAIAEQLCWEARIEYGDKFTTEDWLEEAEDYILDLPTIEVSEDCISRAWVLNGLSKMVDDWVINNAVQHGVYEAHDFVKTAPSVVPTTEQSSIVGEWISQEQGAFYPVECSNCHKQPLFNEDEEYEYTKYCPYCGAKMKG